MCNKYCEVLYMDGTRRAGAVFFVINLRRYLCERCVALK